MKRKFLVVAALVLMTVAAKAQEFKIGYTYLEYIVLSMPEMEAINSELDTYMSQLEAQVQAKQKDIQTKYAALQQMAQQPNANQVVLKEKENEIRTLSDQLEKFSAQADQAFGMKQAEKYNPVYTKVQDAIEAVRKENGYAMILNSRVAASSAGIVIASDTTLNITELVFKKLGVPMPKPEQGEEAPTTGTGN
ncbi:MAG: OmpH family outer membrane protein [Cytophagia bacterium]|nr:OmpH family outer membrane protein [Cytophagia bacterium]